MCIRDRSYIVFFIPSKEAIRKTQSVEKASLQDEKEKNSESKDQSEMSLIQSSSNTPSTSTSSEELKKENAENGNKPINWDLFKPHKQIYLVWKLITCKERRHRILPPLIAFVFIIYGFVGELTCLLYTSPSPRDRG